MDNTKNRLEVLIKKINTNINKERREIENFFYTECDYCKLGEFPDEKELKVYGGEAWGKNKDSHVWFIKDVNLPDDFDETKTVIEVETAAEGYFFGNPQFEVFIDGELTQGLDYKHTSFSVQGKRSFRLALYGYIGKYIAGGNESESIVAGDPVFRASLIEKDTVTEKFYYDVYVPYCALDCLSLSSKEYYDILNTLQSALTAIDFRKTYSEEYYESVGNAQKIMDDFYTAQSVADSPLVTLVGQTHIDVAWLWTKKQVKEKAMRSFATALELMSKYDEFKFMMSQPALYSFVKKENPKLYGKIKQAVKKGKWEPNGALWVECDCNMISGESMARQLLYGKRFFKKEFGKDVKVAWLPDTFGFSGALPQIFKKAGVNSFVTSKLTWNEEDTMPYDTFSWKGIDGSKILGYFLTAQDYKREGAKERLTIYNAMLTVSQVFGSVDRYEPKKLNNDVLLSYGFGDGGGGPTEEYLETMKRLNRGVNGIPKTESGTLTAFMDKLVNKLADDKALPEWTGELYFEHHRGTYTSVAKIKANNRKAEFSLLNAETASVLAKVLFGISYPREKLYEAWTLALTNQFHDVLPGSSIKEVYAEAAPEYDKIFGFTDDTVNFFMKLLQDSIADNLYVVFNPNSKTDKDYVRVDGKYYTVENLPSKGYKSVSLTDGQCGVYTADKKIWNKFYTVTFDDDYNIVSIVDNRVNRELVRNGCVANKFVAYEDYNASCDAWEIQSYYRDKSWEISDVVSVTNVYEGARAGVSIKRKYLDSVICQNIYLYSGGERIDFETTIEWNQDNTILKVQFPFNLNYSYTSYDTQFGRGERSVCRNTSWDEQRFEVCMHKFVDVSESDYGVSILNNAKYAYDTLENMISLTLLKSATFPNVGEDNGVHKFTYSLFPHTGRCGVDTALESYKLNNPVVCRKGCGKYGDLPEFSFIDCDKENVVIETLKLAEDSDDVIVRLYDCDNRLTNGRISFAFNVDQVKVCDIQENDLYEIPVNDNSVFITVKPFEIVTLKVIRSKRL